MTIKILWVLFAVMAILVGLYPFIYFIIDREFGLLQSKPRSLLADITWNAAFYTHILLGGLTLLIGWTQFSKKIRLNRVKVHRQIGKVYIIAALVSALAGFYIAIYATGGLIAVAGFMGLAIAWFYSTLMAYIHIRNGRIDDHQKMMIYSFAACFAAVTLRIWLPILIGAFNDFNKAYLIVAWLCWVPNLIVAYYINRRIEMQRLASERIILS